MAKRQYQRNKKRKSRYSDLEVLAFKMGRINQGLKKDTKVKDAYDRGLAGVQRKPKKPVC